jgi:recombination protein RecR
MTTSLLEQLIDALRVLPGVGQKSAQRMAYHLLERQRDGGRRLADALAEAMEHIGHCERCRDFSETSVCPTCASNARDMHLLCAVETPADRLAIEQATGFRGLYFVLQGRLSPLDGIGPRELGLDRLAQRAGGRGRCRSSSSPPTPPWKARRPRTTWRSWRGLAACTRAGLPTASRWGGELEYVDRGTLSHAFGSRSEIPDERSNGERAHGEHN